jgi:hypothetical protein
MLLWLVLLSMVSLLVVDVGLRWQCGQTTGATSTVSSHRNNVYQSLSEHAVLVADVNDVNSRPRDLGTPPTRRSAVRLLRPHSPQVLSSRPVPSPDWCPPSRLPKRCAGEVAEMPNGSRVDLKCYDYHGACQTEACCGLEVWIASRGGTGTNMLREWARSHAKLAVGSPNSGWGQLLVHSATPSPKTPWGLADPRTSGATLSGTTAGGYQCYDPLRCHTRPEYGELATTAVRRAVYVYSTDPCAQVRSLYRRGYIELVVQNVAKMFDVSMDDAILMINTTTFDDYLALGNDALQIESQWDAWLTDEAPQFPIMAVNFDTLWDHTDEITRFMGVPPTDPAQRRFPKPAGRKSLPMTPAQEHMCGAIYSRLRKKIAGTPPIQIRFRGQTHLTVAAFQAASTGAACPAPKTAVQPWDRPPVACKPRDCKKICGHLNQTAVDYVAPRRKPALSTRRMAAARLERTKLAQKANGSYPAIHSTE